MDNDTFSKDFWKYLLWFGILVLIICLFPIIFTRSAIFSSVGFIGTGEIGDTIGGIMGPFIAIAAALLTFFAFWVQYKANEQQKRDLAIERFENKFYKMLDIHIQNSNNIEINNIKGKKAFEELCGELEFIHYMVSYTYMYVIENNRLWNNPNTNNLIAEFKGNQELKKQYLTNLSYGLFFYGHNYVIINVEKPEYSEICFEIKRHFNYSPIVENRMKYSDILYLERIDYNQLKVMNIPYRPMLGHNGLLGHYYRNLFHIVKYISSINDSLISEEKKYDYAKLLRAQLSDCEQILLFYNSISDMGKDWNIPNTLTPKIPQHKMGYIARYLLIKNIPFNIPMFGTLPHVKYEKEMSIWKTILKNNFFEQVHLPTRQDGI